jgi:uncharacterized protein (TIGR03083 family)
MMPVIPDRQQLCQALETETRQVASLLRAGGDARSPVPGLRWTALEVAAHLSVVLHGFSASLLREPLHLALPAARSGQTMPQFLAEANESTLRTSAAATLADAADAIDAGARRMVEALTRHDDLRVDLPTPWYGPGRSRSVGTLGALAVSETLVHGHDLACALGGDRRVNEASARVAAATVMSQMLPLLLDPGLPDGFAARFLIQVRGSQAFVLHVAERQAWSTPPGDHDVDCRLTLSPAAALLVGFRRLPIWRAAATGRAVAVGRRPWLAWQFGSAFQSA